MNAIAIASWPRIRFTSGTLEALKWLAFAAMLVDHVNQVMFDRELGTWATIIGRQAFPIFALVFGYNLARPGVDALAIAARLLLWGGLATVFYWPHFGIWPLNVLLTLAAAAIFVDLSEHHPRTRWWFFLAAGCLVDYLHPGVGLVLCAWAYARRPGAVPVIAAGACFGGMALLNPAGVWSLLALPVLVLASRLDVAVPRARWAFLGLYVGHLALLEPLTGV